MNRKKALRSSKRHLKIAGWWLKLMKIVARVHSWMARHGMHHTKMARRRVRQVEAMDAFGVEEF